MCTVSWMLQANGYQLFCNRDEKKTRPIALPPRVHSCAGVQFLAPVDTQSGGSWLPQLGFPRLITRLSAVLGGRDEPAKPLDFPGGAACFRVERLSRSTVLGA